jgi:hypothetical protein
MNPQLEHRILVLRARAPLGLLPAIDEALIYTRRLARDIDITVLRNFVNHLETVLGL